MCEAILERWGKNLGVRLPTAIAKAAYLHVGQRVRVEVEDGRVTITPEASSILTLAQRLALYEPARHGGEWPRTVIRR